MNSVDADLTQQQGAPDSASGADPAQPEKLAGYSEGPIDGRSARWAAHREQRRDVLIRAARKAVHRLGPDASMEEIAAAAGTSKSVFYRYFGDKAGLQQAVGDVVISQMQETVLAAAQSAASPRQGLKNMVAAYLHMAQTSPRVYAFVTQNPGLQNPAAQEPGSVSEERSATKELGTSAMPGIGGTSGALGSFFTAIIAMVTVPLDDPAENQPHTQPDSRSALAYYWPTAAIGLVRTAGELWLSDDPQQRPDADAMADQITHWLYDGVEPHVDSVGIHPRPPLTPSADPTSQTHQDDSKDDHDPDR